MTLRIGRIAYLNVAPYFHYLEQQGFAGDIVAGVPSELNRMLAAGSIDACPSSSYEYGLHAADYLLLPGQSISSVGPVRSVLLFTPGPLNEQAGNEIVITGESATSVNLLQILLKEFCGWGEIAFKVLEGEVDACLEMGRSVLLIGDRALAAAQNCPPTMQATDLGALWYHFTGLPFVFALWILRKEAVERSPDDVSSLASQLCASRDHAFRHLPEMAGQLSKPTGFSTDCLEEYWRSMSYDLSDGHLEGLRLYFTLCHRHGLLSRVPDFHFWVAT
jgi:chorismate dehydratase